jgi:hypothetical protein
VLPVTPGAPFDPQHSAPGPQGQSDEDELELSEEELPEDELPEDELPEDELPEDELPEDELAPGPGNKPSIANSSINFERAIKLSKSTFFSLQSWQVYSQTHPFISLGSFNPTGI